MSNYNPTVPRAWSRVQSLCTDPLIPEGNYTVYIPLIKKNLPPVSADLQNQMLLKGNILQFKKNSSNLTKNQKYTQLAKGAGPSRKKSYATQGIQYSNPNTSSYQRINSTTYVYPNSIPGAPNNQAGPFQTPVKNPYGCTSTSIEEGGSLICNKIVNPCSNVVIKEAPENTRCYPITASDVPGFSNKSVVKNLCWYPNIQTWYPRQRRTMSNSGNKWPTNYKSFVPACLPSNISNENLVDVLDSIIADNDSVDRNTLYFDLTNTVQFKEILKLLDSSQKLVENGNIVTVDDFVNELTPLVDSLSNYVINLEPRTTTQESSVTPVSLNNQVSSVTPVTLNNQESSVTPVSLNNQESSVTPVSLNNQSNTMISYSSGSTELNQLNSQLMNQLNGFIKNDTIRGTNTNIFTQTNEIYTFRDIINTLNSDIISKSLEGILGSLYQNVGKDLQEYTDKYSLGENLQDIFTYTVYRKLAEQLLNESFPSSPNYTYIYNIIVSCLEGLYKSVIKEGEYQNEIKSLQRIIDDLRNPSTQGALLDVTSTIDVAGMVREEIKIYVTRYGFPPGGIFEADKLAIIIAELTVNGN